MSEKEITNRLCRFEILKRNFACRNVKYFYSDWECDALSLNKSGYLTEYEVKISRSDFFADFKKHRHQFFEMEIESHTPNYFYYACPPELIKPIELPTYAGLVYVNGEIEVIKKAPLLHRQKRSRAEVLEKFLRVLGEREFLGCCLLTYKNRLIREKRQKQNLDKAM